MSTKDRQYNQIKMQNNIQNQNLFLDNHPSQVHFLMIDKCNARCIMCGGNYYSSKSGKMITLDNFKKMAGNIELEKFAAVVLAGAGDPLLNPDIIGIIQFINQTYPHLFVSITTNGIALSKKMSEKLLKHNITEINISINSAQRDTFRRIMQVDAFERVCRNAQALVELRSRKGSGPSLQFSSAISRLNIEELPDLVELAHAVGAGSINLMYCRFYPERIRHLNVKNRKDRLLNQDSLYFHQELSDTMILKAKSLADGYGIVLNHEPLFRQNAPAQRCTWPYTQLMIGFSGEVYPCGGSEVHFKEKVENGIYNFGNALEEPLEKFWNDETYITLRVSSQQGDTCLIPECKNCANLMSPNDIRSHIMQWDEAQYTLAGEDLLIPMVSVIVPTYNRPDMLVNTIQSILAQTFQDFEIIVVNDCGKDVKSLVTGLNHDNKIVYVRHSLNRGLSAARNTGILLARGKYISYLDDDDIYYPDHLETLVNYLENSEYKIAYTDAYRVHMQKVDGKYSVINRDIPYSCDFDYDRILVDNFVPVLCFMHEKSCLDTVGMFDETLITLEDWDLWIRLSRTYSFAHIRKVTAEFSWRTDGTTMTDTQLSDFYQSLKKIYSQYSERVKGKPHLIEHQQRMLEHRKRLLQGIGAQEQTSLHTCKKPSMVSIIILCLNQLEYTKLCLESIKEYTSEPFELIIVDNGSTDGTVAFLQDYAANNEHVRLILNKENLGFARGNNQGIEVSSGEYILFLNNDVIVTEGWLSRMMAHMDQNPDVSMAGPVSNSVSGPQQAPGVPYGGDISKLNEYAKAFSKDHTGETSHVLRLVGFCLLIRKEALDLIGGFDTNYKTGNFEDDDLCLRSFITGHKHIIAKDVFVHHFGSMSFKGNSIDYHETMDKNKRLFFSKWGHLITEVDNGYEINITDENRQTYVDEIIKWGEELFDQGNYKQSVLLFQRALQIQPNNSRAISNLGVIMWQTGDIPSAINIFINALNHNPENFDAFTNLAASVQETGRYDLVDHAMLERLRPFHGTTDEFTHLLEQVLPGEN